MNAWVIKNIIFLINISYQLRLLIEIEVLRFDIKSTLIFII